MIAGLEAREKDLKEKIRKLDRKAFRRGVFDIGELTAEECGEYFRLNFRARIYENIIMQGDDRSAIRNRVAEILSGLDLREDTKFHGSKSNAEIADECDFILKAIGE